MRIAVWWQERADSFAGGEDATPESPLEDDVWHSEELGLTLDVHPSHLLDADDFALLDIWREWRGGMAPGHLPFAGGSAEQPACVMAALRIMEAAWQKLQPKRKDDTR